MLWMVWLRVDRWIRVWSGRERHQGRYGLTLTTQPDVRQLLSVINWQHTGMVGFFSIFERSLFYSPRLRLFNQ